MARERHTLATYVSDMLALERHVRIPFQTQAADPDFAGYQQAQQLADRLSATSQAHVDALERLLAQLGGHEADAIKSAVLDLEGLVASAIDLVRKTKVSKALRDDYAALALCCVSYEMLLATANAFADRQVSELAQSHLTGYGGLLVQIGNVIPSIVVRELGDAGLDADDGTVERSDEQIRESWRSTARMLYDAEPPTQTGIVESSGLRAVEERQLARDEGPALGPGG